MTLRALTPWASSVYIGDYIEGGELVTGEDDAWDNFNITMITVERRSGQSVLIPKSVLTPA